MPFKKGKSGNPKGRPSGSKNKETLKKEAFEEARRAENEDFVNALYIGLKDYIIGRNGLDFWKDIKDPSLTPRDRLTILERYAQYAYPKRQSTNVDLTARAEGTVTIIDKLSELSAEEEEQA